MRRHPFRLLALLSALTCAAALWGCAEEIALPFDHSRDASDTSGTSGTDQDSSGGSSGGDADNDTSGSSGGDVTPNVCGNGVVEAGEACDDGPANSDTDPRACRTNCTRPFCGNGVIEAGEQCDSGAGNSDSAPNACRGSCTLPTCGDGVTDNGEQCDDGNTIDGDDCANSCVSAMSALCQPCQDDAECGRPIDTCEQGPAGGFCAIACDPDAANPCPDGYTCAVEDDEGARIGKCLPATGECREVCGNGLDDDADTLIDCADPDCATTDPRCGAEVCDDGFDNDADLAIDCADSDCLGAPACQEDCTDNLDNDLDLDTDCADSDCASHPRCQDACASPTACNNLPPSTCLDSTTRRTFSVACTSTDGVASCDYPPTDTPCPDDGACVNGACVNPCAPSPSTVCTATPAPTCANPTTVTTFAPACTPADGLPICSYPSTSTTCPPNQACSNGTCSDPCDPNPCTNIPSSTCTTDTTIATYAGVCSVVNGAPSCAYNPTTVTCPAGQVCSGNSCVSPSSLPPPSQPGQVIFTEVMFWPNGSFQQNQWFEIHNTTNNTFNLGGCCVFTSTNSESFKVSVTGQTLILSPGEHAALSPPGSGLPFTDFTYSGSEFVLNCPSGCGSNAAETLRLECGGTTVACIANGGTTIDQITFATSSVSQRGHSLSLDPDARNHTANDSAANWCQTSGGNYSTNTTTNRGTPRALNPQCP